MMIITHHYQKLHHQITFHTFLPLNKPKRPTTIIKRIPPLSMQLFNEDIEGQDRLYKYFFPDEAVEDLSSDQWEKIMTYDEVNAFVNSINLHYSWNQDSRSKLIYLFCSRGKSKHKAQKACKINCPARVNIMRLDDGTLRVVHNSKHSHSFYDQEFPSPIRKNYHAESRKGLDDMLVTLKKQKILAEETSARIVAKITKHQRELDDLRK